MLFGGAGASGLGCQIWSDSICGQGFVLKIGAHDGLNSIGIGRFLQASWAPTLVFRAGDVFVQASVEEIRLGIIEKYQFKPYVGGALRSSAPGRDILLCQSEDDNRELSLYAAALNDWRALVFLNTHFTDEDARVAGLTPEHLEILAWSVLEQIIQRISDARLRVADQ
jgi:hypothetical protein